MGGKEVLGRLRITIGCHLRNLTSYLLFLWLLFSRSHPLELARKSAIVFSPHQDDETLGCGGMIALKRQLGVSVKVVFITDGRYGSLQPIRPEEMINTRRQEAIAALNILGVKSSDIYFLEQLDGSLATLQWEQSQNLIEQLSQMLRNFMPEEIYVPHCRDFHTDHEATYSLVQTAIAEAGIQTELWQYPIWLLWQNPLSLKLKLKDLTSAYRLSIRSVQNQKHRAIETYQSQIPGLTRGFLQRFFTPYELFFKARL